MSIDANVFGADAVAGETAAFNAAAIAAAASAPLPDSIEALREVVIESYAAMQGGTLFRSERARTARAGEGGPQLRIIDAPAATGAYVYFHGGGWSVGRSDIQDVMLERLVAATGLTAISVEYRLAPEHPFPAPLDDCEAAARWTGEQGFGRLLLGGESAGANLALAVAIRLRDRPARLPVAGLNLLYGAYDLTLTPSAAAYGTVGTLTTPALELFYGCYAPEPASRRDPEISPLFADLRGLPPALLTVGTADPLLDDSLFLHARLLAAGVESQLHVHPGGMHMFDVAPLEIAASASATIAAFLARERVPA
jgi:acetyl esterase/lipase